MSKMIRRSFLQPVRLAILSFLVCGLIFPLFITGVAQLLFPNQANGEITRLNGRDIGSNLIGQNFSSPMFFHPRPGGDSASGVDPDITVQDAYSQIQTISAATGIRVDVLRNLVDQNVQQTMWITGDEYINVLNLNIILIQRYPSVYKAYS
jgi:K+-transporting ATPase ATPase C chain